MFKNRKIKSFSLMELMIVVIILGLLASLIMPNILGKGEQAKRKLVCVQFKNFSNNLKMFKADNGKFPETEEGLKTLINNPNQNNYKNYPNGGYLSEKSIPKDPWGFEYIYVLNGKEFSLYSFGSDGKEGGSDENKDISMEECLEK